MGWGGVKWGHDFFKAKFRVVKVSLATYRGKANKSCNILTRWEPLPWVTKSGPLPSKEGTPIVF